MYRKDSIKFGTTLSLDRQWSKLDTCTKIYLLFIYMMNSKRHVNIYTNPIVTYRVFDFLLKEKLRDILSSVWGMFVAVFLSMFEVTDEDHDPSSTELLFMLLKFLLAQLSWLLQVLVLSIVLLCPLAVLYVLGMYISTAVSLWRLIANAHGSDSKSENMKPALIVLYSLAMAQGLLFGYMAIYGCVSKARSLAKLVAKNYSLDVNIVCDYLDSTVIGCNKDSSFIRGRNLITYAMDLLMESKTSESYVSGVSIIGTILQSNESEWDQHVLIKQCFTGSPSINHMINKLLQTLGPRSPYSREIRAHAARIVAHVAGDIHLEQFPRGIQCISSLLDTFEDYSWAPMSYERHQRLPKTYERDWLLEKYERRRLVATPIQVGLVRINRKKTPDTSENEQPGPVESEDSRFHGYKELVVQGLNILQKLAVDEDNSRVMSNTQGLYSKIMASLISNRAHSDHHDDWCSMAEESLELMSRLMAGPCETGTVKLRVEIASKIEAITSTLEGVLGCDKCRPTLQGQAAEMLLDLSVDTSCIMASESSCIIFISTLLDLSVWGMRRIPVDQRSLWEEAQSTSTGSYYNAPSICWMKKRSYIKDSACQKLESLLSVQGGDIVGHLSRATTGAKISKYRMRATDTLERLYSNYTKDNDFLKTLKESLMTNVIPKVKQ